MEMAEDGVLIVCGRAELRNLFSWLATELWLWTSSRLQVPTENEQSALINAVPSFAASWRASLEMRAEYVKLYPEAVIYAIEGEGGDAMVLHAIAKAPHTERGWREAYSYTHQGKE